MLFKTVSVRGAKKHKLNKGFGTEKEEDFDKSKEMKRINNLFQKIKRKNMKANRTGESNPPPQIENLGDGTFYYNFNVSKSYFRESGSSKMDVNWDYNQVRCKYPIDVEAIQEKINNQKIKHTVELDQ